MQQFYGGGETQGQINRGLHHVGHAQRQNWTDSLRGTKHRVAHCIVNNASAARSLQRKHLTEERVDGEALRVQISRGIESH